MKGSAMKTMLRRPYLTIFLTIYGCLTALNAQTAPSGGGDVFGRVSNASTGYYLRDALVEIPSLNLSTRTDTLGAYRFIGIPAGTYTITASYTALDEMRQTITVAPGGSFTADFDLQGEIYNMEKFVVAGEREGGAAAIMRQTSADNIKSVVAFGGLGGDPTERASEILTRMAGIAGEVNDEGDVTGIYIRGFSGELNIVSMDGIMAPGQGAMSRNASSGAFSGAIFEEIEVVKGMTPDQPAGSIAGAVNIKTYNVLGMKQKSRLAYDVQGRLASTPLWDYIPMRRNSPLHFYGNVSWQELFDVFGGKRNLGVSLGVLFRGNANGVNNVYQFYQKQLDWTSGNPIIPGITKPDGTAYIYDLRYRDFYNCRERTEATLKIEYRLRRNDMLYFTARFFNDHEKDYTAYQLRGYTSQSTASFIDYSQDYQEIGVGTLVLESARYSFNTKNQDYQFGGRHHLGRFRLDYTAAYSDSRNKLRNGEGDGGGQYLMSIGYAGWDIDKQSDPRKPTFQQTAGDSIYDASQYRPGTLIMRNGRRDTSILNFATNLQYAPNIRWKTILKAGASFRSYTAEQTQGLSYWTYSGSYENGLLSTDGISFDDLVGGRLPFINTEALVQDWKKATDSGRVAGGNWEQTESNLDTQLSYNLAGEQWAREDVGGTYVQGCTTIGKLTTLTGIRFERTHVKGDGYERELDPATGTATGNWIKSKASKHYNNYYPSIHFNYRFSKAWKARASWSTSTGRPTLSNYVPSVTPNGTSQQNVYSNPNIAAEKSKNIDIELSYTPPGAGLLTVGAFRKDISDFIYTAQIGTAANGYAEVQNRNGKNAKVQGLELSYQHQYMRFLPKPWNGLGFFANTTLLQANGNYSEGRSTSDLPRFVDKTFNLGLSYRYKKISARANLNYTGEHLLVYSDNPYDLTYLKARTTVDLRLGYQAGRFASLYINIRNILNEEIGIRYQTESSQTSLYSQAAPVIEFGIRGTF